MSLRSLLIGPDQNEFWAHREKAKSSRTSFFRKYHSLICQRILYKNNASIEMQTKIDGRITLPHGLNGILISAGTTIGKNCTVFHQVTIGSNTAKGSKNIGSPQIGDNVYIGAGAKIIGGIKIGNNVRIGANCTVTEDVADNATVVLQKPRVIMHTEPRDNAFVIFSDFNKKSVRRSSHREG